MTEQVALRIAGNLGYDIAALKARGGRSRDRGA